MVLVALASSSASRAADTGGADTAASATTAAATGGEVLFYQQRRVAPDGAESWSVTGSNVVTLRDGSSFTVGFDSLVDPDGGHYEIVADSWQDSVDSDLVSEVRVLRVDSVVLSEDELLAAWLEVHPDATVDETDVFIARRAAGTDLPATSFEMDWHVSDWLSTAASDDLLEVRVVLADQPALDLPDAGPGMLDTDPAFVLDRMEARVLAIEDRKTVIDASQAELRAMAEAGGARVLSHTWLVNAFDVEAPPAVIERLAADSAVARIELRPDAQYSAVNRGQEIRDASQVQQFLDDGYDGDRASGRSNVDDIFVGIIDSKVDVDHPAWKDCGPPLSCGGPRLTDQWVYDSGWVSDPVGTTSTSEQHGNLVAGQLIADLTQAQDPAVTSWAERRARTGMTTESSFCAIDSNSGGVNRSMQYAATLGLDVVNMSLHCAPSKCDPRQAVHSRNDYANALYHAGVFFVHAAGNQGSSGCTVDVPSPAAGTFSVGGYDYSASNLNAGPIYGSSSRGGGADGNAIIDLVAAAGRSSGMAEYDDGYSTIEHHGTSFAAPVVAGAAANLKDLLVEEYGAATANNVGLLHAQMLLMGDGQLDTGVKGYGAPVDDLWGAGRIRMRMWTPAGMDAPFRVQLHAWTIDDGETRSTDLNPNIVGVNQDIPLAVDRFKAAVWWYEPNMNVTGADVAVMRTRVCRDDIGVCTNHPNTGPDAHRLQLDASDGLPGNPWRIDVTGLSVPANADPSDHYGLQRRSVFTAFYWEDRARDDADGPDTGIQ